MLDEWVPFSHRYGRNKRYCDDFPHWTKRHSANHTGPDCSGSERLRCACPGSQFAPPGCCARATQEDRLCDACREHCWAFAGDTSRHRLIDLPTRMA
jgi:hypothetical protein